MVTRGLKHFFRFALLYSFLIIPTLSCLGQTPSTQVADKSKTSVNKTAESPAQLQDSDQSFELNFDERRYSQADFEASTDVESASHGLNVRIGVSLTAGRIELLMRNVRGRVRFRGSLDRIFEVIGKPSAASPEAP